jgi:hypothetical protein
MLNKSKLNHENVAGRVRNNDLQENCIFDQVFDDELEQNFELDESLKIEDLKDKQYINQLFNIRTIKDDFMEWDNIIY